MKAQILRLIVTAAALVLAGQVGATAILYIPAPNGVTVPGVNMQPPSSESDPEGAVYFSFSASAGDEVEVKGSRGAGHYDMSLWILSGLYADTAEFGGSFPGPAVFSIFADDQDIPAIPGPHRDPHAVFDAPFTGDYTVAVTNFLSDEGPPNPFFLTVSITPVEQAPEPGSLALLGLGLAGLGFARRKFKK